MYEGFFGLSQRPFNSVCSVDHYVALPGAEAARKTIRRAIERGEGPTLILGPAGSGKTLLCRTLARDLAPEFDVVMLSNCLPTLSRRELLQSVLFELGLPYKGLDEGELRLAIVETLLDVDSASRPVVMFVDEAHLLPLALLDELRQFGDVVVAGRPRLQLVLAGTIALEETFAHPHLEAFSQRIAARCYLTPLSREDSRQLLANRLLASGKSLDGIFTTEAVENLYRASDGVPRLLTQMADYALVLGATKRRRRIDGALIEEVWADLQQLPPPWAESRSSRKLAEVQSAQHATIEFGTLDEPAPSAAAPAASNGPYTPHAAAIETPAPNVPGDWDVGFATIEVGDPAPAKAATGEPAPAAPAAIERSVLDERGPIAPPAQIVEVLEVANVAPIAAPAPIAPSAPLTEDGFYLEATPVVDRYAALDSQTERLRANAAGKAIAKPTPAAKPVVAAAPVASEAVVAPRIVEPTVAAAVAPTLHIAEINDAEPASESAAAEVSDAASAKTRERRDAPQAVVAPVRRSEYRRMFARLVKGPDAAE